MLGRLVKLGRFQASISNTKRIPLIIAHLTTMGKTKASKSSAPITPEQQRHARRSAATLATPAATAAPATRLDVEEEELVILKKQKIVKNTAEQVEQVVEEETVVQKKRVTRRRREQDPLPCLDPTPELLDSLKTNFKPAPRPVPNLGYACLCMDLRELKPEPVFTSRDCIKRTLDQKGLPYLGELCLANCRDLARIIQWNHEHGIRLFRMSSVLWPWMGTFNIQDVPQYDDICKALKFAGDLARAYDQRVTFHPSHFVKLAAPDDALVDKSIAELEAHSQILDLMGYLPASPYNKINIHVGGVYSTIGSKEDTMMRWSRNYFRLSANCQARMTVENDDVASAFSLEDLLQLHRMCDNKLPLVFDFHHHKFCPGSFSEKEALEAAIATWPSGVRPVVHWSESQPGRKPHAHSDYVRGPIELHGYEDKVDVMIEAKCKERALLAYRDGLPIPSPSQGDIADEE